MWDWMLPKTPPLCEEARLWVEHRMRWLIEEFGLWRLALNPAVLPDRHWFPDPFDGSEAHARLWFRRVCGYMGIDMARLRLVFFGERERPPDPYVVTENRGGAAGLYSENPILIHLHRGQLSRPESMVATMAHELGHVHLLGDCRISAAEPDHEPLTDLLTIFWGFGVFTANSHLQERHWAAPGGSRWELSGLGYLDFRTIGYALALWAWSRAEPRPAWGRLLQVDVRAAMKQGLRYLARCLTPPIPRAVVDEAPRAR